MVFALRVTDDSFFKSR